MFKDATCGADSCRSRGSRANQRPALAVWALPLALLLIFAAASRQAGVQATTAGVQNSRVLLTLTPFAAGLNDPVGIVNAGVGDGRLFVVERTGRIRIVQANGSLVTAPFLDISDRVDHSSGEQGFLGLVFHPNYASNGYFYVNYINTSGGVRLTRISRFVVTADANKADPNSEEILLTVTQPNSNHNAGDLHFGPDGFLYIPLGDGGGGGDTANNAQNMSLLLGKIVRIDVDGGTAVPANCQGTGSGNYSIPADNPFQDGSGGVCDEIWAVGLRNPWRFSFDRATGDIFIGDVGQGVMEEISLQPVASAGGENYGWRCYEGTRPYNLSGCGPAGGYTFPIFEYSHSGIHCSVTGGYMYRGSLYPSLAGHYLLADYCSGYFWDLAQNGSSWQSTTHSYLAASGFATFGEDQAGELYVANRLSGVVFRIGAVPAEELFLPQVVN